MHLHHLLSVVLSLTVTAFAGQGRHLASAPKSIKAAQKANMVIRNFLISDVYTYSTYAPANSSSNSSLSYYTNSANVTLHFVFEDPNSNTSTICTNSWVETNATDPGLATWILCAPTNVTEYFQWQFVSYSGLDNFVIEFAHTFSDPVNYPPPFDVVEYFSSPTNFTLSCTNATGLGNCALPDSQSPVNAMIDGISD